LTLQAQVKRVSLLALVLASTVLGCGSDSGESAEDQVRKVNDSFNDALFSGNGTKACSFASPRYRRQLVRNSLAVAAQSKLVRGRACGELVSSGAKLLKKYGVGPPRVDEVDVDGHKATVTETQYDGTKTEVYFERIGGEWKATGNKNFE
jgi:hypothetical protein